MDGSGACRPCCRMAPKWRNSVNRLSMQLGMWSAFLIAGDFILYTVCFITILTSPPVFV